MRRLVESDDVSLAKFNGAPPQAAVGMRNWINGAFKGEQLHQLKEALGSGWYRQKISEDESAQRFMNGDSSQ